MFNWNIYCKYLEVSMPPYHLSGSKIFISQTPYNLWEGFGDPNFVIELFIIMIVFYPCFSGILYGINSGMTEWLKSDFYYTYNVPLRYYAGKCQSEEGLNVNLNGQISFGNPSAVWSGLDGKTNGYKVCLPKLLFTALGYRFFTP